MKNIICIGFLFLSINSFCQKIYSFNYASQSDFKVFVVDYESQAIKNDGLWYFVNYKSDADKKIYFVEYKSQADLKIYFVKYKSQAGWNENSKKHLLY